MDSPSRLLSLLFLTTSFMIKFALMHYQGTHHLPTWVAPLALWSPYPCVEFSLTSILGRWLLSQSPYWSRFINIWAVGFLQNSYLLIGQLYLIILYPVLEFLFIVDFLRWCFTPSLSSPWHGIFYHFFAGVLVFHLLNRPSIQVPSLVCPCFWSSRRTS